MAKNHIARARRAWPLLVRRARSNAEPFTYGELCHRLQLHHRAASWFLGVIQEYCAAAKLPPLQALAVNAATGLPGSGYIGSGRNKKSHAAALESVRNERWPLVAPF